MKTKSIRQCGLNKIIIPSIFFDKGHLKSDAFYFSMCLLHQAKKKHKVVYLEKLLLFLPHYTMPFSLKNDKFALVFLKKNDLIFALD